MNDKLLKKLILKEILSVLKEEETDGDIHTLFAASLTARLESMEGSGETGHGKWNVSDDGMTWKYDDETSGSHNKALVKIKGNRVKVIASSGGGDAAKKIFNLTSEEDIRKIVEFIEEESGLVDGYTHQSTDDFSEDEY